MEKRYISLYQPERKVIGYSLIIKCNKCNYEIEILEAHFEIECPKCKTLLNYINSNISIREFTKEII